MYVTRITADTRTGTPVIAFTVAINNTYFQVPQVLTLQLDANDTFNSHFKFTLEEGGEVDAIVFSTLDDSTSEDVIVVSRKIFYAGSAPPGVYANTLIVTVVARSGSGVTPVQETRTALLQITVSGKWLRDNKQVGQIGSQ